MLAFLRFQNPRHQRTALRFIVSGLVLLISTNITSPLAEAETLDDSQSPRQTYNVQLNWHHRDNLSGLSRDQFYKLSAIIPNVEIRLDTGAYVGQNVRIFLALPQKIDGLNGSQGLRLNWETRGLFASGSATPGTRSLLFQGTVTAPLLTEFFNFTVQIDAARITGRLRYAPIYEIEPF